MAVLFQNRCLRFSYLWVSISTIGGLIIIFTYLGSSDQPSTRYPSFHVLPFVESYGKLSLNFNLHEWFRDSLADSAKEILVNDTVQRVTGGESTSYDLPSRTPVVLFNVLPKTGSRTLVMLVHKVRTLGTLNITMTNSMDLLKSPTEKVEQINETLANHQNPSFIYSHLRFVDFVTDRESPMYVSIIRDPIDRLASLYYFKRYGDSFSESNSTKMSQMYKEKMKAKNLSDDSFDDCVLKKDKECVSEWMMNAFVYHFSGYDNLCDNHDWDCMLLKAKDNVKQHYALVGMLEDYPNFVRVLENMIPEVFLGMHSFYKSDYSEMRTRLKLPPSEDVRNILRENMKNDYEFYEFVKSEFSTRKKKLGL